MPSFSPEVIQTMRAALDEVMTKIPLEQATPGNYTGRIRQKGA